MTFRPGDCIYYEQAPADHLKKGDVIVFTINSGSSEGIDTVHRIISIGPDFFETRGDNNSREQIEKVPFNQVLGQAVFFHREGWKKKRITGGSWGTLRAKIISKEGITRRVARVLWATLRRSGVVRLFWKPVIETVHVSTDADSVVRLVCKGKTIGKWCTKRKILALKKPWDLVVRNLNGELRL